ANAHEFIQAFPQGYDTIIGERGLRLSGGQKQRVAVARAMLKDAPILVLDEATSALDTKSERAVQAGLEELMKDRTTLIIAHRLSTIANVDTIITLDKGVVDEKGSPAHLSTTGGIYAQLLQLTASTSEADRERLKKFGFSHETNPEPKKRLPRTRVETMKFPTQDELRARFTRKWTQFEPDVLPLFIAESDFPTAPAVKKVLLDYTERECFGYSPAPGAVGLGDAVADFHESRYGWRPDPKKVFWIGDVVRGLLLGIQYFTRPDSPVVVPLPAYPPF